MWNQVLAMLRAQNNVGPAFRLCCPRHTDIVTEVFSPADFERLSPEGGCQLICERRLACGHQCVARCHSESLHAVFSCPKPCERLHGPCQHSCQKYTCGGKSCQAGLILLHYLIALQRFRPQLCTILCQIFLLIFNFRRGLRPLHGESQQCQPPMWAHRRQHILLRAAES